MTRVLFLAESFHPVLGGGEKHIVDLSGALVAAGMPATVLTRRASSSWYREEQLGQVRVLRVPPPGPGRIGKYAMILPALAALRRERATYDVVSICGTRVLGGPGLITAHRLGRPVVLQPEMTGELSGEIYVWGTAFNRPGFLRLFRPLMRTRNRIFRRAERCVAISRPIEREFLEAGFGPEQVVYIPHAVDTERFRPADPGEAPALRARLGLPVEGELIAYTGRLLKGKGLEVLVDALARIKPRFPTARLVIIGSGAGQSLSIEGALKERVGAAGLSECVTFTGRVDNVPEYLRAASLFAFPSLFEGLPHSIVEAAAAGLASVASRAGGIPDVVEHEGSGLLVDPGDVSQLAEALARLLAAPEMRVCLGRRARVLACERFSLKVVAARYFELFSELGARPAG